MNRHPSIEQKTHTSGYYTCRGELPVQDPRPFWGRTISACKLTWDKAAADKLNGILIPEQQKTLALCEQLTVSHAGQELVRRQREHVAKLESGTIPLETEFTHSLDSVTHDLEQQRLALYELLKRQIKAARPVAAKLVKSILSPLEAARSRIQEKEEAYAAEWGSPLEPSFGLKLLASHEQLIEGRLEYFEQPFDSSLPMATNPTRSDLLYDLPPGIID